jgi:hypothetical protein
MQPTRHLEAAERRESEHSGSPRMLSKVTNQEQERCAQQNDEGTSTESGVFGPLLLNMTQDNARQWCNGLAARKH